MPGLTTTLGQHAAMGFARHPYRADYPVLVHAVLKNRIVASALADLPPPSDREHSTNCWFRIPLADLGIEPEDLLRMSFLIGETDEFLDVAGSAIRSPAPSPKITVEEMIGANVQRPWITGATFLDAERAGLKESDIIDLLYIDILGRRGDPDGLQNYLTLRRQDSWSFNDVRKSLLSSPEYSARRKDATWAPGSIFSHPITQLLGNGDGNAESGSPPVWSPSQISAVARPDQLIGQRKSRRPPASAPDPTTREPVEIVLSAESALFGPGWHGTEHLNHVAFRWMDRVGILFNPKPELACCRIALHVAAVYGAKRPQIECRFDETPATVQISAQGTGFLILMTPPTPQFCVKVKISSQISGCPQKEGRGDDDRVLSLNVLSAQIAYGDQIPIAPLR